MRPPALTPAPYEPESASDGDTETSRSNLSLPTSADRMPDRKCPGEDDVFAHEACPDSPQQPSSPGSSPPRAASRASFSPTASPSRSVSVGSRTPSMDSRSSGDERFDAKSPSGKASIPVDSELARHAPETPPRRESALNMSPGRQRRTGGSSSASAPVSHIEPILIPSKSRSDSEAGGSKRRTKAADVLTSRIGEVEAQSPNTVVTDSSSEDDEYSGLGGYDIESLGRSSHGGIPTWSTLHKFRRQLDVLEKALERKTFSPKQAEKELLNVARFAVGPKTPDVVRERREALIQSKVLPVALRTFQKYISDERTATIGCSVVSVLATNDPIMQAALGRAGAVQVIVQCIEANSESDVRLIESGLRALSSLVYSPGNREKIREQRGIDVVVSTMGKHCQAVGVQTEVATLLANCAFESEENKVVISSGFGIDLLVTAMKTFPNEVELQARACQAIRNITFNAPDVVESAGAKGAVIVALAALSDNGHIEAVVEQAVVALYNLAAFHPENVERIVCVSGYMDCLLQTLQNHPDSDTVQATSLSIIEAILRHHPASLLRMVEAGGIQDIVDVMKTATTRDAVMSQGAATLLAALQIEEHKEESREGFKAVGGVETLFEFLYVVVTYRQRNGASQEKGVPVSVKLPQAEDRNSSSRRLDV